MHLQEVLADLERRRIKVYKHGLDLLVAPASALTPELRRSIQIWKPALWFLADPEPLRPLPPLPAHHAPNLTLDLGEIPVTQVRKEHRRERSTAYRLSVSHRSR